ncbi:MULTISPECIES: PEP/pyruvate-binding domain-containing protein [Leifsonia]|uniref:PEP/pyruvate-binding domain-containing protein n=1 Tax=Leifsonia TaxID=110932 RepID=UPI0028ABEF42|nr:PEP/pyruvate-binding domain-containing protein [Leifsonia aquatica]
MVQLDEQQTLPELSDSAADRAPWGSKAANLAFAAAAGFRVPPGFVITDDASAELGARFDEAVAVAAARLATGRFAVRSSGSAEDLAGASYAGLYETLLDVEIPDLAKAIRSVFASAAAARVSAYESRRSGVVRSPMAVLVQAMVAPVAAGVAFSANPLTGTRDEAVISAVRGLAEPLVSGEAIADQWIVKHGHAHRAQNHDVLSPAEAIAVAALARRAEEVFGSPQDIEWAIDEAGRLFLIQARPMTALPELVDWIPPGPGLWSRNFRLGEWLPEAMTPLFAEWIIPRLEAGYLAEMWTSARVQVPFPYATVNGWYYNATPTPSARTLWHVLIDSRGRAPWFLYNVLARVSSNPPAADRAILRGMEADWRERILPTYRSFVESAAKPTTASEAEELVDHICSLAGQYLWSLAVVGGSAWKMEGALSTFWAEHLDSRLDGTAAGEAGPQALLRGLTRTEASPPDHAVYSLDWYFPTAGERAAAQTTVLARAPGDRARIDALPETRSEVEAAARAALSDRPRLRARFDALVEVAQRYAILREEQTRDLTLGWPLLRQCAQHIGQELTTPRAIAGPDDVFFLTHDELRDPTTDHHVHAARRRVGWEKQRRLDAPLTLGTPPRLIGDPIARAVNRARATTPLPDGVIVGHPASVGRATGTVRVVTGPEDFADFRSGDILVAKATAPAWTQLFSLAAAVVTDGGTLAAHASLIAREYGIPAVVGTGDATARLRTGQTVTVDGGAGTVAPVLD